MNEKKYGRSAHHIRKQMEEQRLMRQQQPHQYHSGSNSSKHTFKPTNNSHTHSSQRYTAMTGTSKHNNNNTNRSTTEQTRPNKTPKPTAVDASTHPSWEAKRRQKEQEAALLRAKPSGTKIIFDDDD